MDEPDLALYNLAINEVAKALEEADPLVGPGVIWATATEAVKRLIDENLIIEPQQCQWTNGPKTIDCENLAPLTRLYCYIHGN